MKDGRVGDKELLVASSHERGEVVCGEVRCLPKKQELNTTTGSETYTKFDSREGMDSY